MNTTPAYLIAQYQQQSREREDWQPLVDHQVEEQIHHAAPTTPQM